MLSAQYTADLPLSIQRLQLILDAQADLARVGFNLDSFMEIVALRMQTLTGATGAVIELVEGEYMVYRAASGSVKDFVGVRLPRKGSLSGMCVDQQTLMISHDTSVDPRVDKAACNKVGAASMMVVPLMRHNDAVGVLKIASTKINAFQEYDVQTLRLMGGVLGALLAQQVEAVFAHHPDAFPYDSLTGLPSSAMFLNRLTHGLDRATRKPGIVAVFYIGLNRFQAIEGAHGAAKSAKVLQLLIARIQPFLRRTDVFVRHDDDVFAVLMEGSESMTAVQTVADHIAASACAPFNLGDATVETAASIGIATTQGILLSPEILMNRAERALRAAKKEARGTYHLSDAA